MDFGDLVVGQPWLHSPYVLCDVKVQRLLITSEYGFGSLALGKLHVTDIMLACS